MRECNINYGASSKVEFWGKLKKGESKYVIKNNSVFLSIIIWWNIYIFLDFLQDFSDRNIFNQSASRIKQSIWHETHFLEL